jgi:hypothetical protein
MTPAKAQPTCVWEMVVVVRRRVVKGRLGVQCADANSQ